jgi:PIN domain nuclease of toxin-antitoxin system
MAKVVLDASALLAYIHGEPGAEQVAAALNGAVISTVNLAEAVTKLVLTTGSRDRTLRLIEEAEVDVVNFDRGLAEETGLLAALTRGLGLSLGDRACLALARREGAIALTADNAWRKVDLGIEIQLIR